MRAGPSMATCWITIALFMRPRLARGDADTAVVADASCARHMRVGGRREFPSSVQREAGPRREGAPPSEGHGPSSGGSGQGRPRATARPSPGPARSRRSRRLGTRCAITIVTHDRKSGRRQMGPNLVGPARVQARLDQRPSQPRPRTLQRVSAAWGWRPPPTTTRPPRRPCRPMSASMCPRPGAPPQRGTGTASRNRRRQARPGEPVQTARARRHQHAAGRGVQPVGQPPLPGVLEAVAHSGQRATMALAAVPSSPGRKGCDGTPAGLSTRPDARPRTGPAAARKD